jgi:hypothetical protein
VPTSRNTRERRVRATPVAKPVYRSGTNHKDRTSKGKGRRDWQGFATGPVVKTGKVSLRGRCRLLPSQLVEPPVLPPPQQCGPVGKRRKRQPHTRRCQPKMRHVVGRRRPENQSTRRRIMRIPACC